MTNLISMKCPSCGADLQIESGRKECFCTYCGTKVMVDNGEQTFNVNINQNINQTINSTHHEVNEAEIIRAKTEQFVAKKDRSFKWSIGKLCLISWIAMFTLMALNMEGPEIFYYIFVYAGKWMFLICVILSIAALFSRKK